MIVFSCCSSSFSTFNHKSCPFLYFPFFLNVLIINHSIIYRQTFALRWAPSLPDLYIFIYRYHPAHPPKCKRNNWMPPLLFLCNILRTKWVMKLIFWMQINIKIFYHMILTLFPSTFPTRWYYQYWWAWSSILRVLKITSFQYLHSIWKRKLGMELIFWMQINIKVSTSWH